MPHHVRVLAEHEDDALADEIGRARSQGDFAHGEAIRRLLTIPRTWRQSLMAAALQRSTVITWDGDGRGMASHATLTLPEALASVIDEFRAGHIPPYVESPADPAGATS